MLVLAGALSGNSTFTKTNLLYLGPQTIPYSPVEGKSVNF